MRSGLIIGLLVSVALHGGLVLGSEFFKGAKPAKPKVEEVPVLELTPVPPPEPDPVEPEVDASAPPPPSVALPSQNDTPSLVIDTPFTQVVQPPAPKLDRPAATIVIPQGKPIGGSGFDLKNAFDLAALDQKPAITFSSRPIYPFEMRRRGIEGSVVVGFAIDVEGEPHEAYAVSSSHPEFENAAIQAILKSHFKPGKKAGAAVATRNVRISVDFKLDNQ